jgi:hypothetical protein
MAADGLRMAADGLRKAGGSADSPFDRNRPAQQRNSRQHGRECNGGRKAVKRRAGEVLLPLDGPVATRPVALRIYFEQLAVSLFDDF